MTYHIDRIYYRDQSISEYTIESFFTESGNVKSRFKKPKENVEESMNKISYSLYKYQKGITQKEENDW